MRQLFSNQSPFVFKKFILYGIVKDLSSELRSNSNPNLYFVCLHHKLYSGNIKQIATSNPLIEIHLEKSPVFSHIEAINASVHMNAKSVDWYNYCLIEVANNVLTMWHESVTNEPDTNTMESSSENFSLGQEIAAG